MTVIDYILTILIVLFTVFQLHMFDVFFLKLYNMFMRMHLKKRYDNNKRLFNIFIKEIKVRGIYDDYIKYCRFKNINVLLTCFDGFKIKSFTWFAKDDFFIGKTPTFFLIRLSNMCMCLDINYGKDD